MNRLAAVALILAFILSACADTYTPAQPEDVPPVEQEDIVEQPHIEEPTDDTAPSFPQTEAAPEFAPRTDGVPFVMPQQPQTETADELLEFVHGFSRSFIFPEFADVSQMDFEDASVSSNLLHATTLWLGKLSGIASLDDMNLVGRGFFGDEFEFPRGIETWDVFGEYVDGIYRYGFQGRGGICPWRYLLLDYSTGGENIVATFLPFQASADWSDGAIDHVMFLYPYDFEGAATARRFFDIVEDVAYLEERVLPGYDGHILEHVFLVIPQEELGTITVTFRREEGGNLVAIRSVWSRG